MMRHSLYMLLVLLAATIALPTLDARIRRDDPEFELALDPPAGVQAADSIATNNKTDDDDDDDYDKTDEASVSSMFSLRKCITGANKRYDGEKCTVWNNNCKTGQCTNCQNSKNCWGGKKICRCEATDEKKSNYKGPCKNVNDCRSDLEWGYPVCYGFRSDRIKECRVYYQGTVW